MDFRVGLTDEAIADLAGIVSFVAKDSPAAAERVGSALLEMAESLNRFPHRGAPLQGRPDMRRIFKWRFAIYYRVKDAERSVEVLRIWDGRQAPWTLRLP